MIAAVHFLERIYVSICASFFWIELQETINSSYLLSGSSYLPRTMGIHFLCFCIASVFSHFLIPTKFTWFVKLG